MQVLKDILIELKGALSERDVIGKLREYLGDKSGLRGGDEGLQGAAAGSEGGDGLTSVTTMGNGGGDGLRGWLRSPRVAAVYGAAMGMAHGSGEGVGK
ncbi:hypothetical protein GUJ93_ZPchr0002g23210 [Zizania palustris]|uniref:Uncharacterized protein n=1 Tax=Zizania palustris TaxID=103762 RepID=A0A8J5VWT6_ZIZPA|nr:hypothetical protein GUJ93_ZPchr0002g23210 [Zizania palustris]